jgi:hypothetical protein
VIPAWTPSGPRQVDSDATSTADSPSWALKGAGGHEGGGGPALGGPGPSRALHLQVPPPTALHPLAVWGCQGGPGGAWRGLPHGVSPRSPSPGWHQL